MKPLKMAYYSFPKILDAKILPVLWSNKYIPCNVPLMVILLMAIVTGSSSVASLKVGVSHSEM